MLRAMVAAANDELQSALQDAAEKKSQVEGKQAAMSRLEQSAGIEQARLEKKLAHQVSSETPYSISQCYSCQSCCQLCHSFQFDHSSCKGEGQRGVARGNGTFFPKSSNHNFKTSSKNEIVCSKAAAAAADDDLLQQQMMMKLCQNSLFTSWSFATG